MQFTGWDTAASEVRRQAARVSDIWTSHLGGALVGAYVHGSMALGCFAQGVSDLDLLLVVSRRLDREERLAIARDILEADLAPCPLELSAIRYEDIHPWRHPTPCQFHYSDLWTAQYRALLDSPSTPDFLLDSDFEDPDIACHARLTRERGICLVGAPAEQVLPCVPEADFWDSLTRDLESYDFHAYLPRYFASNLLILGRVLSYGRERRILSKYEGGLWTLEHIPQRFRPMVSDALRSWYAGEEAKTWDPAELEALRTYLIGEIRAVSLSAPAVTEASS